MSEKYKNLILTNHACHRLSDRSLRRESIYQVVNNPEKQFSLEEGKTKFIKTVNERRYHVIAKHLDDEQKWLVISIWVRGEEDRAPLSWQLITLPFKGISYILKQIWQAIFGRKTK